MQYKIDIGFEHKKNMLTHPINNTFSHQCNISTFANTEPDISVVTPLTISWWTWCDILKSKGDFLNLITRINTSDKNIGHRLVIKGVLISVTEDTLKDLVTR